MKVQINQSLPYKKVLPWICILLLLSAIPYISGLLVVPENKLFVGTFVNPDDLSTYLSAMRQGQAGKWLYQFPFSPEPWQPKLMLLPYLVVGKIVPDHNYLLWFHLFRIGAQVFTLTVFWWWVRVVWGDRRLEIHAEQGRSSENCSIERVQLTTWLLLVFGSGFGWLLAIFGVSQIWTPDLFLPEMSTFMALFHTPHFALGLGLEVLFFGCVIKMVESDKQWRWICLGSIVGVGCALTYVYHLPILGLVTGLFLLGRAWQQHHIPWREWLGGGIILLPLTLLLGYYYGVAYEDPYFAAYAQFDHIIPAPSLVALLIGLGLLGILALLEARQWFGRTLSWLVPIWAVTNILVLYVPIIEFTGRFVLGLLVPVATMAGFGLETAVLPAIQKHKIYNSFSNYTKTPYQTLRLMFFLLMFPAALIVPIVIAQNSMMVTDFPTYIPQAEVEAMAWLGQQMTEDELVLADYPIGNYLPRHISGKVFLGQLDFTTDLDSKLADLDTYWHEDTSDEWRASFVAEWHIDYIYQGGYERQLMQGIVIPEGEIIYDQNGIVIYHTTTE